jgi:hypothetical protein
MSTDGTPPPPLLLLYLLKYDLNLNQIHENISNNGYLAINDSNGKLYLYKED